jgi:hypothetical protein
MQISGVVTLIRYCLAAKFSYRQQPFNGSAGGIKFERVENSPKGALLHNNMLFRESTLLTGINLFPRE